MYLCRFSALVVSVALVYAKFRSILTPHVVSRTECEYIVIVYIIVVFTDYLLLQTMCRNQCNPFPREAK